MSRHTTTAVANDGPAHRYFVSLPNLLDDTDIDPFAFRVYAHLVRRASGGSVQLGTRTIAAHCHMSAATVHKAKQTLLDAGLIEIEPAERPDLPETIHLIDIWEANMQRYARPEQPARRRKQQPDELIEEHGEGAEPVRHTNTPVRHTNTPVRHTNAPVRDTNTPVRHTNTNKERKTFLEKPIKNTYKNNASERTADDDTDEELQTLAPQPPTPTVPAVAPEVRTLAIAMLEAYCVARGTMLANMPHREAQRGIEAMLELASLPQPPTPQSVHDATHRAMTQWSSPSMVSPNSVVSAWHRLQEDAPSRPLLPSEQRYLAEAETMLVRPSQRRLAER